MQAINAEHHDNQMTMVFPCGVLALFILSWGFLSDHLGISIALLVLAEGIKLQNLRWNLNPKHFQNIADFTTVLFAVVAVYQFVQYGFHGIYGILGLLPLVLFPLLFAQRLASKELFPMSALFLSLRKKIARGVTQEQWVSTEMIYALACLLGASTGAPGEDRYFYIVLACVLLLLWISRPRTSSIKLWLLAASLIIGASIFMRAGMEFSYRQLESTMGYWFSQYRWSHADPSRARTAIGHIGRLKLSDRIILRLKAPLSIPLPIYLHDATYTKFRLGSWHAPAQQAVAIDRLPNTNRYSLLQKSGWDSGGEKLAQKHYRLEITAKHAKDVSVQTFPIGSVAVESEEIIELKKNALGTISLEAIPGQLRYEVAYRPADYLAIDGLRGLPGAIDSEVPEAYQQAFEKITLELGLKDLSPKAAIARVHRFFQEDFRYSLVGKGYYPGKKPLLDFLTKQRSGHCEYFATATTLLLRTAGIPARYSVGYLVDEYSSLEKAFVARARHAHAWTEAYVDGHWQLVDTTPANWLALEQDRVSRWQSVQDYIGWLGLHISRLQRLDRSDFNRRIIWLVPALLVLLMWRLRNKITIKQSSENNERMITAGKTSPDLAKLMIVLKDRGVIADHGQTIQQLLMIHRPASTTLPNLMRMLSLYYIERFSNSTLTTLEKKELTEGIENYIENLNRQDGLRSPGASKEDSNRKS